MLLLHKKVRKCEVAPAEYLVADARKGLELGVRFCGTRGTDMRALLRMDLHAFIAADAASVP